MYCIALRLNTIKYQLYIPALIVAVGIMICSLATLSISISLPKPIRIPHLDKFVHILMYLGFALTLAWANIKNQIRTLPNALTTIAIATVYGGVIELLQKYYFPPRTGEWLDWVADILGATIGSIIIILFYKRNRK